MWLKCAISSQVSWFREEGWWLSGVWKQWGVLWSADCFLTSQRSGMQLGTEHLGMNPWIQVGQVFFLFICQSVSVSGKEHKQFVWYQAGSWATAPISVRELTHCGVAVCQRTLRLLVLCFSNTGNWRGAAVGYWPAKKKLMSELMWHLMVLVWGFLWLFFECFSNTFLLEV